MLASEDPDVVAEAEAEAARDMNGPGAPAASTAFTPHSDATSRAMFAAEVMGEGPRLDGPMRDPLPASELVPPGVMWALTAIFAVIVVLAANVLLSIWPEDTPSAGPQSISILWRTLTVQLTANDRMMLVAILSGVLGAMVHTMTSFADFAGNKRLARSWLPWYLLRPFIGMALALFFYVVVRTGILTAQAGPTQMNAYGIAAIAGLAGMFSKQATDKLNETFSTLFKTGVGQGDDTRHGKLATDAPKKPVGIPARPADETRANGGSPT